MKIAKFDEASKRSGIRVSDRLPFFIGEMAA